MKQQTFTTGIVPIKEDFNALSSNTIEAVQDILTAIGGTAATVLFKDAPALVTPTSDSIDIDIPTQPICVDGVICVLPQTDEFFNTVAPGSIIPTGGTLQDYTIKIYAVIYWDSTTATRNSIEPHPTGGSVVKTAKVVEVQRVASIRHEMLYTAGSGQTVATPTLSGDDVGYVEICTIDINATVITVTGNTSALFAVQSGTVAAASHAAAHLPGGGDPIQEAATGATLGGSTPGLVPAGGYAAAKGAVQSVEAATGSEFLTFATVGDNSNAASALVPKKIQASLGLAPSLEKTTLSGNPVVGVKYAAASILVGSSTTAARKDHRHSPEDIGYLFVEHEIALSSSTSLGSVEDVIFTYPIIPADTNVTSVVHLQLFWRPDNLKPEYATASVEAGWTLLGDYSSVAGARALITGTNSVSVEIGNNGITYLTPAAINKVNTWLTSGNTVSAYPSDGSLVVRAVCTREDV